MCGNRDLLCEEVTLQEERAETSVEDEYQSGPNNQEKHGRWLGKTLGKRRKKGERNGQKTNDGCECIIYITITTVITVIAERKLECLKLR
jgi:hypothetical protein